MVICNPVNLDYISLYSFLEMFTDYIIYNSVSKTLTHAHPHTRAHAHAHMTMAIEIKAIIHRELLSKIPKFCLLYDK